MDRVWGGLWIGWKCTDAGDSCGTTWNIGIAAIQNIKKWQKSQDSKGLTTIQCQCFSWWHCRLRQLTVGQPAQKASRSCIAYSVTVFILTSKPMSHEAHERLIWWKRFHWQFLKAGGRLRSLTPYTPRGQHQASQSVRAKSVFVGYW